MTVCLLHQLRKTQGIPDPSTMWDPHPSTSIHILPHPFFLIQWGFILCPPSSPGWSPSSKKLWSLSSSSFAKAWSCRRERSICRWVAEDDKRFRVLPYFFVFFRWIKKHFWSFQGISCQSMIKLNGWSGQKRGEHVEGWLWLTIMKKGEIRIPLLHDLIIDVTVITTKNMMLMMIVMLMSKVMMM